MTRPPCELSNTYINCLACPFRYQELAINGYEEPDSDLSHKGTVFHVGAAKYGRYLAQNKLLHDPPEGMRIFAELVKPEPWNIKGMVMEVARPYCEVFLLERGYKYQFEQRIGVDRNLVPCHAAAQIDRLCGTFDMLAIADDGRSAKLTDYKSSPAVVDYNAAMHNQQLMIYAALAMWNYESLESVDVSLWLPRWGANNKSDMTWTRETALPMVQELMERDFKTLDMWWAKRGNEPWDNEPCAICEPYCLLPCPDKYFEEVYA